MANSESDDEKNAHYTYTWTIKNLFELHDLYSPTFTVQAMDKTEWYLYLSFDVSGSIELCLQREYRDPGPDSIGINFELCFLGIDGIPLIKKLSKKLFEKADCYEFSQFADQDEVFAQKREEFLPEDVLTVRCWMWKIGTEISKHELCFAHTLFRYERGSSAWAIREFSTLRVNEGRRIFLNPTAEEGLQVTMDCFITEENDEQYVCIDIPQINFATDTYYDVHTKTYLLDIKKNIVHPHEIIGFFSNNLKSRGFIKKSKLTDDRATLLPNDVLSLRCEFKFEFEISGVESYRCLNSPELEKNTTDMIKMNPSEQAETSNVSSFTGAMKSLLLKGTLSDINLRTGSRSFPAHKCILSSRSPVFEAMFSRDMKEKTSQSVDIPDIDGDTLRELLSYIYTDTMVDLKWRGAADLYRAADKYELLDLKGICSTFLKSNVSVSNVCSVLGLADIHHDQELRETAQDFVVHHKAEVFSTDAWRSFKEENSKLALEIVERILCNIERQQ